MEGIFNSKDLYEYLEEQKQMSISKTREIALYYKATSKSMEDDEYSLRIWLDYIRLLIDGSRDSTEARETFKMIKMRFCKFYNYWEAYIRFEAECGNEGLGKIVQQSIEFVKVKEFPEKRSVLEHLKHVENCINTGRDPKVWIASYTINTENETNCNYRNTTLDNCIGECERLNKYAGMYDACNFQSTNEPRILGNKVFLSVEGNDQSKRSTNRMYGVNSMHKSMDLLNNANRAPSLHQPCVGGVSVKFDMEDYSQGITSEINAMLGRTTSEGNSQSPRSDPMSIRSRQRMMIKNMEIEVLSQIGKGGSSKVYKVLHGSNVYALKRVELVGDEKMLNLYTNEINLLYKFKGTPEIVEIMDHEIGREYLDMLLEYGETDLSRIIKAGKLSMNFIKDVWEQMLLIVKRVHMERIIHCDLKPANFLFVKGRVKLIDFGISKVIRNDTTSILSEEQCGTVNYMSPEAVMQSKSKMGRSSDIWSLGCILYEMVHSRPPLHEYPNIIQKIQKLQEYSGFKYASGNKLAVDVMKECLVKDPKKRPTIDALLSHRFITGEDELGCTKELVQKVLSIVEQEKKLLCVDDIMQRLSNTDQNQA
ncbi:mitogen-activated protein kinase [Ordospora colligata]|uniref:Mitogen-activated protein kinase n=1 Tax=Ordospora colligata OC4 TaxID=1354746 RepID=A0A0B2UGM0_9MICR|nr:mitogen-activated protein kinase [Ordospora colligata OC4]KHN70206.1 mitogen-activated protein kinase [Ordospora colligata OC4]TBU16750.1 mitogen-activated protein kinase [Ordospora colligata]TBU17056.1 mitogen-activated protein kinase [Ordospora colligata]TBU19480.1 mitogen-activated protein kinase [Ordospora colligata]